MGVLEQTYNTVMDKPLRILNIFNEFFGENRVDMQGFPTLDEAVQTLPEDTSVDLVRRFVLQGTENHSGIGFILVHFPHVRISNEYDRYTDINHLYAKVKFDLEGKIYGRFLLNRAEYTVLHFSNNYMHSHISHIPTDNFQAFQAPCTGTGPINNTICSLSRDFDEDLWRLFCLELDRFVQVESIAGTPYHRLESLIPGGSGSARVCYTEVKLVEQMSNYMLGRDGDIISYPQFAEFIKYVIDSNILKFSYQNDNYCLAMSATEYYIKLSNLFIKWYNKKYKLGQITAELPDLFARNIIGRYKFVNNSIVCQSSNRLDYHPYLGAIICTFKGQPVRLTISDAQTEEPSANDIIILNQQIGEYIFTKIFNVLNFRYGNRKEEGVEPNKKVYFL